MLGKQLKIILSVLAVLLSLTFLLSLSCADAVTTADQGLQDRVQALEDQQTVAPPYINVKSLTQEYLTMVLTREGDYPVIVTLYGSGLSAGIVKSTDTSYNISNEYLHDSHMLTIVVEPAVMWQDNNNVKLSLKDFYGVGGLVYYATADCGG